MNATPEVAEAARSEAEQSRRLAEKRVKFATIIAGNSKRSETSKSG
jgi:hypothetical protein